MKNVNKLSPFYLFEKYIDSIQIWLIVDIFNKSLNNIFNIIEKYKKIISNILYIIEKSNIKIGSSNIKKELNKLDLKNFDRDRHEIDYKKTVNDYRIKVKYHSKSNLIIINYLIKYLIITGIFIRNLNCNKLYLFNFKFSKISLTLKGIGESLIFNPFFEEINYPNLIKINGEIMNSIIPIYESNQTYNFVELIWNNSINDATEMFLFCSEIIEIDLSEFDASQTSSFQSFFEGCTSLISINLNYINTSNALNMYKMFKDCESLTSLNLYYFNTSKIICMDYMFDGCSSLISLDLSSFDFSGVTSMAFLFRHCLSLAYINIKNLNKNVQIRLHIFYEVPDNVVICINKNNNIFEEIENKKSCFNIYCGNDWRNKQRKIIDETNECIDSCTNNLTYKYEYNGKCYNNCNYYYYVDIDNKFYCTHNLSCPDEYPLLIEDKKECVRNNINIHKSNDILNTENSQENLYIEKSNDNSENNSYSTSIEEEKIHNNIDLEDIKLDILNYEKNDIKDIKYYDIILKNIESVFTSNYFNTSNIDNGKDEIIKSKKITVTLTNTQNQKNNYNNNIFTIDLGQCEILLKEFYNISNNGSLYIKTTNVIQERMKIQKIEYDIYSKLNKKNLVRLNITACENSLINLFIPIIINDNIDKYNSSSGYYNDICYTTTSESGTDISINDRRKDYVEGNKSICQEECIFSEYDYNIKKAKCICKVKKSSFSIIDMIINKKKLYENFGDFKNIANVKILGCFHNLFSKMGIRKNIGSYLMILIITFHTISLFIFYINQSHLITKIIDELMFGIKNSKLIKNEKRRVKKNIKIIKFETKIQNSLMSPKSYKMNNKIERYDCKTESNEKKIKYIEINQNNHSNIISDDERSIKKNIQKKNNFYLQNNPTIDVTTYNLNNQKNIEKLIDIMKYTEDELNLLNYELALKYDERTYFQYYISLLKTKHILLFSFCNNDDYNSKIIKINLFFIGFTVYYTINALFYNDDTMHNIYEKKGSFDLEYQLPKIVYSSVISIIINVILKILALSNDNIIDFKQNKNKYDINKRGEKLKNKLRIKFILYFILSFIFILFFWYYLAMFGAVYINTQYYLLKDTLISFSLSLLYPFGIYLLPGVFRLPALSSKEKKEEYLYNFSKILQML